MARRSSQPTCRITLVVLAALVCVAFCPAHLHPQAQTAASAGEDPAQQLQALAVEEQQAVESGDPAAIAGAGRQLGAAALRALGNLSVRESDFDRAGRFLEQSLALEENADARLDLALSDVLGGRLDRALAECKRVTDSDPENARAWKLTGQALAIKGDDTAAAAALTHAWEQSSQPETGLLLITSDVRAQRPEQAGRVAQQIVQAAGDSAPIHVVIANAYRNADDLAGTIRQLTHAIQLDPQFASAHLALGDAYWELNEYQYNADSLREFAAAQRLEPEGYLGNLELGSLLSQYQRYREAAPLLERAAALNPASPDPWLQVGMNAYDQAQTLEARTALEKAVTLSAADPSENNYQVRRAYAVLSRIEAGSGNTQKAEQLADHAEQIRQQMLRAGGQSALSESTGLVNNNAPASKAAPNPAKAMRAAALPTTQQRAATAQQRELERQLLSLAAKSLNDAGTALARTRDYAGALPMFRQAAAAEPTLSPVMRNLGLAAFHTGAYAEAADAFTHALEQDPGDELAQNYLEKCRAALTGTKP